MAPNHRATQPMTISVKQPMRTHNFHDRQTDGLGDRGGNSVAATRRRARTSAEEGRSGRGLWVCATIARPA
jgi:hypothetical protein